MTILWIPQKCRLAGTQQTPTYLNEQKKRILQTLDNTQMGQAKIKICDNPLGIQRTKGMIQHANNSKHTNLLV